jgi:ribosome-binding factor A
MKKNQIVCSQVQKQLANILLSKTSNPILQKVTITSVDVAKDYSQAKVYFHVPKSYKLDKVLSQLETAQPFLRSCLADSLSMRHTPRLLFFYDQGLETTLAMEELLAKASLDFETTD